MILTLENRSTLPILRPNWCY